MTKFIKKNLTTILLLVLFLVGLSLLLYPSFADWFNNLEARRVMSGYSESVAQLDQNQYEEYWRRAEEYNHSLKNNTDRFNMSDEQKNEYNEVLKIPTTDVMAMIKIPSIDLTLPIYHGTDDAILQNYIGHLEGSSLPIGGPGTHAVLSGHRGLPSAKLFTDLPELEEGDYFMIEVLDQTLTYQVDQISVIEPEDYSDIQIDPAQDYVTLMTCTPYGINTHRLLVRGHRVDNLPDDFLETRNEGKIIDKRIVALFVAIPILIVLFIWLLFKYRKKE